MSFFFFFFNNLKKIETLTFLRETMNHRVLMVKLRDYNGNSSWKDYFPKKEEKGVEEEEDEAKKKYEKGK